MTKIYGFGNALIDLEIPLSNEELTSLNIKKGSMIHITSQQKRIWLKKYNQNIVSKLPGGSIANSLYAASRENSTCLFSCSLGEDKERDIFLKGFTNSTKVFHQISKKPTGVCFIFITPDGERTMASNLSANKDLLPKCLNKQGLADSDWLVFDAFTVCTSNGFNTAKEAIKIAKENKLKIAFGLADINLIKSNLSEITWVLKQGIDLLAGNQNEIKLLKQTTKIFIDTLCSFGSEGASFNNITVSAKQLSIVNTNGAGDALLGVFLDSIDKLKPKESLKSAIDYASKVCQVKGPRL